MVGIGHDQVTPERKGTTVKKKVAVVSVADVEEAARLADLPLAGDRRPGRSGRGDQGRIAGVRVSATGSS